MSEITREFVGSWDEAIHGVCSHCGERTQFGGYYPSGPMAQQWICNGCLLAAEASIPTTLKGLVHVLEAWGVDYFDADSPCGATVWIGPYRVSRRKGQLSVYWLGAPQAASRFPITETLGSLVAPYLKGE